MIKSDMKIELVDKMGSDLSVVNAARVSFHKVSEFDQYGSLTDRDANLINHLAKNGHWTPFSHAFLSFRVKMPIFVARQLIRHTVGLSVNEVSRRYVDDTPEFYQPPAWRNRPDKSIKQGSGSELIPLDSIYNGVINLETNEYESTYEGFTDIATGYYERLLEAGVAPEMARMVLPLSCMTEWIWSGSLYAFARVYNLRADKHAQAEIQILANDMGEIIEPLFPYAWAALTNRQ